MDFSQLVEAFGALSSEERRRVRRISEALIIVLEVIIGNDEHRT